MARAPARVVTQQMVSRSEAGPLGVAVVTEVAPTPSKKECMISMLLFIQPWDRWGEMYHNPPLSSHPRFLLA